MTTTADKPAFPGRLLRSRIVPPRQQRQLIERARLLRWLEKVRPGQVVLACAPPGFGKSVALAQWSARVAAEGGKTAWLNIDNADEPLTVAEYLGFSCHSAGLRVPAPDASRPRAATLEIQSLLAAIESSASTWLLVLDDVERASAAVVREILEPLYRFLPDNMILALATREAGPLELSFLIERGLLVTLDADTLRFDRDEVQTLWGASATRSQVRTVEQRSGGWPALLQIMLQQGLTTHFDSAAVPASGAAAAASFFETRLLSRLDESVREALLRLSVLGQFSNAVARELLDTSQSALDRTLTKLSGLGVLSRSDSEQGVQYLVYPLLRDYLAARFESQEPSACRDLHRRAAQVFLRHGELVTAARHAAAANDPEFLAEIVEAANPLLLGIRAGFPLLRQIVRLVPESLASTRPRIGYASVLNNIKAGRLKDAERLFLDLEERVRSDNASPHNHTIEFERAMARSMLAVYKGTPISEREIHALDAFIARTAALEPIVRSLIETLRSFVWQQHSRFIEAEQAARLAMASAEQGESAYAAYFMYCDLGMLAGIQGRAQEAFGHFEAGDRACSSVVRTDERLTSIRDAFRLELEHEIAPASGAATARLKNICIRLPSLEGWPDIYSAAFRTCSEQLFLNGDVSAALAILSVGIDYLQEQEIIGAPTVLRAQRILLLVLAERDEEARREWSALPAAKISARELLALPWREAEALAEAEAAMALVRRAAASKWLAAVCTHAQSVGNIRSEIRLRTWQASLNGADARSTQAITNAARLATISKSVSYGRTSALISGASSRSVAKPPAKRPPINVLPLPVRSPYYLTPREFDVLACLERGLSDKAIAKELQITAHGVRYHLKRIYAKLHVSDRAQAREKAGRLGLM